MITDHHDGFGLNDIIEISADDPDPNAGHASHHYRFYNDGELCGELNYQHGPRHEEGSTDGLTDEAILCAILHRYRGFQSGPFRCRENAIVITKLEEAVHWMHARARTRAKQRVLGKNLPHES
jgi:hypothetical protein